MGVSASPLDTAWGRLCDDGREGLKVGWPTCAGVPFKLEKKTILAVSFP